jgi:hypothetical protein
VFEPACSSGVAEVVVFMQGATAVAPSSKTAAELPGSLAYSWAPRGSGGMPSGPGRLDLAAARGGGQRGERVRCW